MNAKFILSLMVAGLSMGAQANNCGTTSMFERGTNNNWTTQNPMFCNFSGQWQITTNFTSTGRFKFDVKGDWSENYGDNTPADSSVNAGGADIVVNQVSIANTGSTGIFFDYPKKTYSISRCFGPRPSLDSGGLPPTPRSMDCGLGGIWSQNILFAPSRVANPDTSSPWPNGISSVKVLNEAFQEVTSVTPPVSGRYLLTVNSSASFAINLLPQDCGGLGLNLSYVSFTGKEQNLAMTCDMQTKTYSVDYDPAISGNPFFRFIDGADIAYGDNLADGTLDISGNGISVTTPSRITVNLHAKTYQIQPLNQPCGTASLALLAPNATGHEQSHPMTCGADNKWHFQLNAQTAVPFRLQDAQGIFWGDNQADGQLDSSGNLILAQGNVEVIVDYPAKTYQLNTWKRTLVFIYGQTSTGQDMFVRGGIDHAYALAHLGLNCTAANKLCAIPIKHRNLKNATTAPWKTNDNFLDWYGAEANQSTAAQGSPLDWTTNLWPASWGTKRTLATDGYGETLLNTWGHHYWVLDVDMDCSKTVNGWFELKSFSSNGPGWEGTISQSGAPYISANHFAQCGKLNKFERNSNAALIQDMAVGIQ